MFGGVGVAGRVGPLLQLTTRAAALPPVSVVVLGLLVGVYNVFIFFPFLVRFIPGFRSNFPSIYYRPVSDSPGVPENFDEAIVSAMRTAPTANNFTSVYANIVLTDGVIFTCRMPKCRYYSVVLYAGMCDPVQDKFPPSLADDDIEHNADGSFDVVISETRPAEGERGASNWLPSQGIREGLVVIRRYGTLPGQVVEHPAFFRLSDGEMLKPPYRSYSGSHYAESNKNHRFARLLRVLRFMVGVYVILIFVVGLPLEHVNVAIAIASLVPIGVTHVLYEIGRRRHMALFAAQSGGILHKAMEAKLDFDVNSPRPHPEHKYFFIGYNTTKNDVVIKGRIVPGGQKFWDLSIHSIYTIPHFHTFTDETIVSSKEEVGGDERRSYRIVLTRNPKAWAKEANVVDVSKQVKGVVVLRLVYPTSDAVFQQSRPEVNVLPLIGGK